MALPIPSCPVVVPSFPVVQGNIQIDPVTGSTQSLPVVYTIQNVCDEDSQKKFNISMNINENVNCQPIPNSNLTIKGSVPVCATKTDIETLVNYLKNVLKTQFPDA